VARRVLIEKRCAGMMCSCSCIPTSSDMHLQR
jgi:hypothetical protein